MQGNVAQRGLTVATEHTVGSLVAETITALGKLDAGRLETLAAEAEAIQQRGVMLMQQPLQLRALQSTLQDVLRGTEGRLRVLRGLHGLHLAGLTGDEGLRWER